MFKVREGAIKGHVYDIVNPTTIVGVTPPIRPVPETGTATIDPLDMEVYQQEVKSYMHNKELLQASMMRI